MSNPRNKIKRRTTMNERNIINMICSGEDPAEIYPLSLEEEKTLAAVYTACRKIDLDRIISERQRNALQNGLEFLIAVPEIHDSLEFCVNAILAWNHLKFRENFDFNLDMKGFMTCYRRIEEAYWKLNQFSVANS